MGKIIRRVDQPERADPTFVTARRVEEPSPPPAGMAGAAQNVFVVVAPAAAATPPPVEVHHHHHHTTQVVAGVRRRRPSKGTSFLGTLGFVLGGLACGTAFAQQVAVAAPYIAIGGLVAATLAWCGAVLFRRVGATMPFVGIVVSAAGYGLGLVMTGQAQGTYDGLRSRSPVSLPAVRFPAGPVTPPVPADQTPVRPPQAAPPVAPGRRVGEGTIFDPQSGGWVKPSATRP